MQPACSQPDQGTSTRTPPGPLAGVVDALVRTAQYRARESAPTGRRRGHSEGSRGLVGSPSWVAVPRWSGRCCSSSCGQHSALSPAPMSPGGRQRGPVPVSHLSTELGELHDHFETRTLSKCTPGERTREDRAAALVDASIGRGPGRHRSKSWPRTRARASNADSNADRPSAIEDWRTRPIRRGTGR